MILILTDKEEPTSDLVIDWLLYYKAPFIRLSIDMPICIKKIYSTPVGMECVFSFHQFGKQQTIDTKEISAYWYRRSGLMLTIPKIIEKNKEIFNTLSNYNHIEYKEAYRILNYILDRKSVINTYSDADDIIKLKVLDIARKNGLRVPDTIVCADKETVVQFYNKHGGNIITKTLGDPISLFVAGFRAYTSKIEIDKIPEKFALSLFQEMVEKEIELRIFYLRGKFYASAIFSQLDVQTKLDFKNYNKDKPNRVIPFLLERSMQEKLKNLMSELNFNSGSLDIVLTPQKEYVFLEVNPVGQFEQVSFPCNYNLFKILAQYLISYS